MKMIFIAASTSMSLTSQVFADFHSCDPEISRSFSVGETSPISLKLKNSTYQYELGGKSEEFTGTIDKEAVKRVLLFCAPGISDCLSAERSQKISSGEMSISFELTPDRDASRPSNFKFESPTLTSNSLKVCLASLWKTTRFPLLSEGTNLVRVKVPLKISSAKDLH